MDTHTLALQQSQLEKLAMRPEDLTGQIELIQAVMRRVMKEGEHYGKIPGTDKLTLLQPGAEKLILTFRLGTEFTVIGAVEEKDFISYSIRCDLFHIPTGNRVASGIGSCNSRESKYRYRFIPSDKKPSKAEADQLKRLGLGRWRKADGQWVWFERIENDNPWDFQNTILKMAAKRAKVAATLNATAASDIFTQDVEDMDLSAAEMSYKPGAGREKGKGQPEKGQPEAKPEEASAEVPAAEPPAVEAPAVEAGVPQAEAGDGESKPAAIDMEALRAAISDVTTMTKLELLWKENAKTYEADERYKDIRKLFIEQRQFIQEAQAMERGQGQGEAA